MALAFRSYYWSPSNAMAKAIEMQLYLDAGVFFHDPALDLGCGDGQVGRILKELDLVGDQFYGVEISARELQKAKTANVHQDVIQADANHLPFDDGSFSSVVSNGVLCSIPNGVDSALKEVHRVLKADGLFVCTVPTDRFAEILLAPRLLRVVSTRISQFYVKRFNHRFDHFNMYAVEEWSKRLEDCDLQVLQSHEFFSKRTGHVWNVFILECVYNAHV